MRVRWAGPAAILGAVVVAVVSSCGGGLNGSAIADDPDCPHYWQASSVKTHAPNYGYAIPGTITNDPEYHDCQRFIVGDRGRHHYDAVEAIFIRDDLNAYYQTLASQGRVKLTLAAGDTSGPKQSSEGRTPAKPTGSAATSPARPHGATAAGANSFVVAEVVAQGPYPPLGIKTGLNCLALEQESSGHYSAWMDPVMMDSACVATPYQLSSSATKLEVGPPILGADYTLDFVPPVARWDWDSQAELHYIGVKCPDGWCEVHMPGPFTSSPSYKAPPAMKTKAQRAVVEIKGYYDEQIVAESDSRGEPVVGDVVGTVFPHPEIGRRILTDYDGQWLNVGWVALSGASDGYKRKYNYDKSPVSATELPKNTLAICRGGLRKCRVFRKPWCDTSEDGEVWYGRTTTDGGDKMYYCVKYRKTINSRALAGTSRWRWRARDERTWYWCPGGCCEMYF